MLSLKLHWTIIFTVLLHSHSIAFSQPENNYIEINQSVDRKVTQNISYQVVSDFNSSIKKILTNNNKWIESSSENITFDLPASQVVARIPIHNLSDVPVNLFLELHPVFLEEIELFNENGDLVSTSGSIVPTEDLQSFPTVQFNAPAGKSFWYLKVSSRSNALALTLRTGIEHRQKANFDLAVFALILGALSFLLLYHLFLFATYRNPIYLYYCFFISASLLFVVSFSSFHKALLPWSIFGFKISFWWSAVSAPILMFTMYLFTGKLLNLFPNGFSFVKGNRLKMALLALPALDVLSVAMIVITNSAESLLLVRLSAALHVLTLPSLGVIAWFKNRKELLSMVYAVSWIPFTVGSVVVVLWLQGAIPHANIYSWAPPIGVLAQSLFLSFAAGQQLNILTREKLLVMDELEKTVKHLKKRDSVITSFVSADIVEELDRGENPMDYKPVNTQKSVVFFDMHDYTTFFENNNAIECYNVMNNYFKIINEVSYEHGGLVDKIIGDAVMVVFDDPAKCIESVTQTRRRLSQENRDRVNNGLKPLKFGAGVSYGTMLSANFGSNLKVNRTLVGDTVNVASRLESITRAFSVDVLCSKPFVELHPEYKCFRPAGYVLLKGKRNKSLVYEMFGHNLPEVIEWKAYTKPYLQNAIIKELDGDYLGALEAIQKLIDECPRHTFKKNRIMDESLLSMMEAIEDKMRQLELAVPERKLKQVIDKKAS